MICFITPWWLLPHFQTIIKYEDKTYKIMTTSQESSRKFSLEMKSEVHYKKAAKSYRKSKQYINMINLCPTLQNTLIECKDENLIE